MNYVWLIVIIILIILFTYIFKRVRNPITNLNVYYKDCTIKPNGNEIINKIYSCYHFIHYYTIYVFKTNELPKLGKSYSFNVCSIQRDFGYYVILVSTRYKLLNVTDTADACMFGLRDGILTIPFIPQLLSYHKFHVVVSKHIDQIPINVSKSNPIIVHNGIVVNDDSMSIISVDFVTMYDETFKAYVIYFN